MTKNFFLMSMAWGLALSASATENVQQGKGFLTVSFEGNGNKQDGLRFTVSEDAKTWYVLNDSLPVIACDTVSTIATRGNYANPYILKGEDGCYYLVAAYQKTEKKPSKNMVLMKSADLVHWTQAPLLNKKEETRLLANAPANQPFAITGNDLKRLQNQWGYVINHSYTGKGNPILPGFHADPEILYSNKTGKYYIYSTTDGRPGWGGFRYYVYSSSDLKEWKNEGVALDAKSDQISWANGNLWAPAAVEVKQPDGSYKYYLYFSARPNDNGRKQMGVAVADSPAGPFVDLGQPLLAKNHPGCKGQLIDVDVFIDPVSQKPYLYWGNSFMAGAELEPSMTKIKDETVTVMTPQGGSLKDYAYREAPYVFYRNGLYYFMWSVDDTGSPNYHVAYGTSKSPLGPIEVAKEPIALLQDPQHEIYGTAHNSVIQKPGTDEWYIVYHRINKEFLHEQPGVHREVCIDKMEFNPDGTIERVIPTDGLEHLDKLIVEGEYRP